MNTNVFRLLLLGSLFSLSACVQQSEERSATDETQRQHAEPGDDATQ